MLDDDFKLYSEKVKSLKNKPPDSTLLILYGLYKQSTIGDCNTNRPGMFNYREKAKWDAWNNYKGKTKDEAKLKYIAKVKNLINKQ